ncbi:hypothetical protein [Symbioplanes lichenis]|uniref:hypothetical protein n=1 Tax=Symbioplanes lichenis TaxID=1629072 RepID=UPI002739E1BF|nr:hypothetical protein [Actinoplanes lichenis]
MSDHGLELRYRRLMMAYPAAYRREYEDEMLGVLMAGTRPGRRRPSLADSADLLRAGLAARLGQGLRAARGQEWRDAAAVAGLLGALVLAIVPLRRLVMGLSAPYAPASDQLIEVGARAALWLLVVVAALAGLRRSAAALALTALAGEAVAIGLRTPVEEFRIVRMLWVLMVGLLVVAMLALARRGGKVTSVLSRRRKDLRVLDRVMVLLTAFATVPFAQAWAELATGVTFTLTLTPGTLVAAVAFVAGLPIVTSGLAMAGLRARENRRVLARSKNS